MSETSDLDDLERSLREALASVETAIGGGLGDAGPTDEVITLGQLDLGIERLGMALSELQESLQLARGADWIDLGVCARRALERAVVDVGVPLRVQTGFPPQALRARVACPVEAPAGLGRLLSVVLRAAETGDTLRMELDEDEREVRLSLALDSNATREGVRRIDSPSRVTTLEEIAESLGARTELSAERLTLSFDRVDSPAPSE